MTYPKRTDATGASIEAQVVIKEISNLICAKIIALDHPLAKRMMLWMDERLPPLPQEAPKLVDVKAYKPNGICLVCKSAGGLYKTPEGCNYNLRARDLPDITPCSEEQ